MKTKLFDLEIVQEIDPEQLAEAPHEELDQADESGGILSNHMYEDLRFMTWEDVADAIRIEKSVLSRLEGSPDIILELRAFGDERFQEDDLSLALWGLDVGVAAATIAISAFGAVPIGSCNGGAFGDFHQGGHPYVAFYLPRELANELQSIAATAQVGLVSADDGIVRMFSRQIEDMMKFAEVMYERRRDH
jgi:hypothetical protein